MREVVFRQPRQPFRPKGISELDDRSNLEELHAARDALIEHFGPSHGAYKVRFKR